MTNTYTIDYNNGYTRTIEAQDLQEAQQQALDTAGLTHANVEVRDAEGGLLCVARWYGIAPSDDDTPLLQFGREGYYDDWADEGEAL